MQRLEQSSFSDSTANAGHSALQDTSKEVLSKEDPVYQQLFNRADKGGNHGTVSKDELTLELTDCYQKAANNPEVTSVTKAVFDHFDKDGNGVLDKTELSKLNALGETDKKTEESILHLHDKGVISADGAVRWDSVQNAEVEQSKKYAQEMVDKVFQIAGKDSKQGQELNAQELSDALSKAFNKPWDGTEFDSSWDYISREAYNNKARVSLDSMELTQLQSPPHTQTEVASQTSPPRAETPGDSGHSPIEASPDIAAESRPRHRARRARHADQGGHQTDGPSGPPARAISSPPERPVGGGQQQGPVSGVDY